VFRDAAQRRRTEAALIEAEARYREIFENAVVGMFQMHAGWSLLEGEPGPRDYARLQLSSGDGRGNN
jgi:hypothetical protein